MPALSPLENGAQLLISRNLGMRRGQEVVFVVDEDTVSIGYALVGGARNLNVRSTLIVVPKSDQATYHSSDSFPLPLARAIDAAQAIVIAVSDFSDGTGFRVVLLNESRQLRCKVAHIPGITEGMVSSLAATDYDLLENRCESLRLPLLLGREVMIHTQDHLGISHELHLTLGQWEYPSIVSSGIVRPQSFDNVPSGEVYVPPLKGTAHGELVINGSVTGYVFGDDDEILATFAAGALVSLRPADHPAAHFLQQEIDKARHAGDLEPHFLCELGIGANPAVARLSGATLMDEKAYGTAHVAIGANQPFGGTVAAAHIHEDLIFRRPTITIDGKPVVELGEIVANDRDWRPSCRHYRIENSPYANEQTLIEWSGIETEPGAGGILQRIYYEGTNTKCRIPVGDNETARLASDVLRVLLSSPIAIADLARRLEWGVRQTQAVLNIMGTVYGVVQIHSA